MKSVRVGVIGLGVGERHAAAYASHPQAEVAALCDTDAAKLRAVSVLYPEARLFSRAEDLIRESDLTVVSVASYDADHFEQIMASLRAGKHVLAEKPLCLREEEAEQIKELLNQKPHLRFSSHFPLRCTPRFQELKEQLQAGMLGQVYLAEAGYYYGRWQKITSGWRGQTPGFSPVLGGGVHLIDLLLWLLEDTVVEVTAYGTNLAGRAGGVPFDDCVVSVLRFASGAVAQLICDLAGVHPHYHALSLFGTSGSFVNGRQNAEFFTSREAEPTVVTAAYQQERQSESDPFFTSFVDAVLGQGNAIVGADEIFRVMSIAFALMRSAATGRPQQVEYI